MSADINSLLAPNDSKLFEQLCQHVLEHQCKTLWGQAYARNGQEQHGVDFYIETFVDGSVDDSRAVQIIGVQCKHKDRLHSTELSVKELEVEVKKAKTFKPAIVTYIIATSAPTNSMLQDKARELTAEHKKQIPPLFSVEVWFWEKIRSELSKDPVLIRQILKRFYPNLAPFQFTRRRDLHQLPTKPAHFIGRDDDLAKLEMEITSALESSATVPNVHVILQGSPGVGKTALATMLAHQLKNRYVDAQLYLNLRGAGADIHGQYGTNIKPLTSAEAMQVIIHAFYPEERLPEELERLSVKYNSVLNEAGRVLLLFDNAADAAQLLPLLPPSNCLLLVTSRAQFSIPGLIARAIGCLRPEKSQELLLKLASRIQGCEIEIAELCGHLPLALKVIAGVINNKKLYPAADLLKRMREGREKLAPVYAAFQLSYNSLADNLQRCWVSLAVFPANFGLLAAAAVWARRRSGIQLSAEGDSQNELRAWIVGSDQPVLNYTRDAMQALIYASLVEWNETDGRFRLHDLARLFCYDILSQMEKTANMIRHARYYLNIAIMANQLYEKGGEKLLRALKVFDRERTNIEAAFEFLSSRKDKKSLILLSTMVEATYRIGDLRFLPSQRIEWLVAQCEAARITKNRRQEGNRLRHLGIVYRLSGEARRTVEFCEQALIIDREIGNRRGEGGDLGNLGLAYFDLGDIREAIKMYEQALLIDRESGDRGGEASDLGNLGSAYAALGELHQAVKFHEEAMVIDREIGDRRGEGYNFAGLGDDYAAMGKLRKAIQFHKQALVIFREIGDRRGEGYNLGSVGLDYVALKKPRDASGFFEQALSIYREIGDRRGEATDLWNSALSFEMLGNRTKSVTSAEMALQIFEAIEDPIAADIRIKLAEWRGQS